MSANTNDDIQVVSIDYLEKQKAASRLTTRERRKKLLQAFEEFISGSKDWFKKLFTSEDTSRYAGKFQLDSNGKGFRRVSSKGSNASTSSLTQAVNKFMSFLTGLLNLGSVANRKGESKTQTRPEFIYIEPEGQNGSLNDSIIDTIGNIACKKRFNDKSVEDLTIPVAKSFTGAAALEEEAKNAKEADEELEKLLGSRGEHREYLFGEIDVFMGFETRNHKDDDLPSVLESKVGHDLAVKDENKREDNEDNINIDQLLSTPSPNRKSKSSGGTSDSENHKSIDLSCLSSRPPKNTSLLLDDSCLMSSSKAKELSNKVSRVKIKIG